MTLVKSEERERYIVKAEPQVPISANLFSALAEWRSALSAYADFPDIDTGHWMNDAEEKLASVYDAEITGECDEVQPSMDVPEW